jgi:hypothetical protein
MEFKHAHVHLHIIGYHRIGNVDEIAIMFDLLIKAKIQQHFLALVLIILDGVEHQ